MEDVSRLRRKRQSLADDILSYYERYGQGVMEQLKYVEEYLHNNIPSVRKMLDKAEDLRTKKYSNSGQLSNIEGVVQSFTEKELPLIQNYMHAIAEYLEGKPFNIVYDAFGKISRLKPISDSAKIPDTEFYKKIAELRDIV